MKKILLFLNGFLILLFLINSNQITGQTVLLSEDFSGFKGGTHISPSTYDVSGMLDQKTFVTGWTGSKIYEANGEIKLSTASTTGWIETPLVSIPENCSLILTFNISGWPGDNSSVQVFINGIATGDIIIPTETFRKETLIFTSLSGSVKVKLAAMAKRFFIDDLILSADIINKVEKFNKEELQIKLFPVPVADMLTIYNLDNVNSILITDMTGRIFYSNSSIEQNIITIPTIYFHAGYYLVRIKTTNCSYVVRFIKK